MKLSYALAVATAASERIGQAVRPQVIDHARVKARQGIVQPLAEINVTSARFVRVTFHYLTFPGTPGGGR